MFLRTTPVLFIGTLLLAATLQGCVAEAIKPSTESADAAGIKMSDSKMHKSEIVEAAGTKQLTVSMQAIQPMLRQGEELLILFAIENTGAEPLQFLPWGTAFEKILSADLFAITFNDTELAYLGRKVKRREPVAADYMSLAPGERVENTVNLSLAYDVSAPGRYQIVHRPLNEDYRLKNTKVAPSVDPLIIERLP